LDAHEILVLLLSSDIECSAESKLNLFEIANKFLNDIYEARNLVKFPPHNESYAKVQTIHLSGGNDFVKANTNRQLLLLSLLIIIVVTICFFIVSLFINKYCCICLELRVTVPASVLKRNIGFFVY